MTLRGWRHYIAKDYLLDRSGGARRAQRFHPIDWKTLDWSSAAARQMMREAMAALPLQPGLVGADLGAERRVRDVLRSTTTPGERGMAGLHGGSGRRTSSLISHLVHQQAKRIINNEVELTSTEADQCNLLIQNEKTASIKGNGEDVPSVFPSH